jgi:uncharacterized protein YPO0396
MEAVKIQQPSGRFEKLNRNKLRDDHSRMELVLSEARHVNIVESLIE